LDLPPTDADPLTDRGEKPVQRLLEGVARALSAGEVGQGYREVADPSVFVKFPLLDDDGKVTDTSLLVWTTTPWTLPSNQFAAVHPTIKYVTVEDIDSNERFIFAKQLMESLSAKSKRNFNILDEYSGAKLLGVRYQPPYQINHKSDSSQDKQNEVPDQSQNTEEWSIVSADFVTTDTGTGVVHIAPAFGEDDYKVLDRINQDRSGATKAEIAIVDLFQAASLVNQIPLINCVAPNGKFTDEAPEFVRGRWVKDCDKDINRDLKKRGLLYHQEQYRHDYPFCWRAEQDPLIQYPRESWFIRTSDHKEQMLANNAEINWLPEHIKDGRFGKFLASNVDWALSRERYWGTPLPIWVCQETGKMEAIGSYEELLAKPQAAGMEVWDKAKAANPELPDDLRVHKPYIDAITYASPFFEGGRMQRVTEVIDCWYDSGAMPFAQWGFRGEDASEARERFESQFPADFISEALDQTRGWFYSQLAISTLLWGNDEPKNSSFPYPHPFKNCIVLGLMLGEDGQKMSKSKRNYRSPDEIFDLYGADALRWFFFAKQPPWTTIRYSEQAIKDSIPEFLLRLWNVYSFFTIYANIDEFDPQKEGATDACVFANAESYRPIAERSELDRWILSELNSALATVVQSMDQYDNYTACQAIIEFVDAMSNWYVRRSRDRFWAKEKRSAEKLDAYWTLYECLVTTTRMIAPFVPFLADNLWQQLAVSVFGDRVPESVHLCDFPVAKPQAVDGALSERMNLVRHISSLGRQSRSKAEIKVRQPLAKVEVILADTTHQAWLEEHAVVIAEELNVKSVEYSDEPDKYVEHEVVPNFKLLGPKLGKLMPKLKPALNKENATELLANFRDNGKVNVTVEGQAIELTPEEIEVRIKAREGWAAANAKGVVVVLATEVSPELLAEGLARDLVRVIQDLRKELNCDFTDRIEIGIVSEAPELCSAIKQYRDYIAEETLTITVSLKALSGIKPTTVKIGHYEALIHVRVV